MATSTRRRVDVKRVLRLHWEQVCAMVVITLAVLGVVTPVAGQAEPGGADLSESFAEGEVALARWEFTAAANAGLSWVPAAGADQPAAVYIDFRERAAWRFLSRPTVRLRADEQYTLSARVRRNLGYGTIRLLAETLGAAPPEVVAEAEVINRNNVTHEVSVVFRAATDAEVRVGFSASGYSELWIESLRLQRNEPPIPSYITGMLLPARSPTTQARYRTGAFLEAEDVAATPAAIAAEDADGDGRWAFCRLDPAQNPWLFSDDTVLKSDTLSAEEGGALPALKLTATGLLPGPYEVILSDPQRDAAVSLDGQAWKRVKGGAGELNLGLIEVTGSLSVWVAHRFRTAANPGPIYVDYVRLMPVYAADHGLEKPVPPVPVPPPPPLQQLRLRLIQSRGVARRQEWVTAGIPFARGACRTGDGVRVEGVSGLATQPLVLWPDGSIKWLRLWFQADCEASGRELPVTFGRALPVEPAMAPALPGADRQGPREGAGAIALGPGRWEGLELGVRVRTAAGACYERLRVDASLPPLDGRPGAWPELTGHVLAADGSSAAITFQASVTETAPQTLGLRFSLRNEASERYEPTKGCGPALPLTEFTLVLRGIRPTPAAVQWPSGSQPFDGRRQTLRQAGTGGCVAEFKGQWDLRSDATVLAAGGQTEGWLDLRGPGSGLAVGVPEFVEKCPRTLAVRQDGEGVAVELAVWPAAEGRVLRFAQGTRLTAEIALVRHDGTLSAGERESRLAAVLDPLLAVLPSSYYCRTGVFGPVTDARDPRFEGYYAGAAHTLKSLSAEHMRYGLEDWGDTFDRCGYVRTESRLWTNMEWNYVATLVLEFVRSGALEFWRAAHVAARHFVDLDVAHVASTPAWIGGAYVHTGDTREGHQVDPPDFAHAGWPEGLLWVYYLAGDRRLRDTSIGLADYVVRNLPAEGPYQAPPPFSMWNCDRQAGNPILTLAAVYELAPEPLYLQALNRLVDYAVRVQDPKLGCWSVPCYEEPARHYPSPAWGAVLQQGLYRYWELTGDERVAQAFRRLGDFHLGRHPAETRPYLKPGSHYRSKAYFVSEACAFASLFALDPAPLIAKGRAPLAELFPPELPRALGARGAPGALSAASRLAGAAAAATGRAGAGAPSGK